MVWIKDHKQQDLFDLVEQFKDYPEVKAMSEERGCSTCDEADRKIEG